MTDTIFYSLSILVILFHFINLFNPFYALNSRYGIRNKLYYSHVVIYHVYYMFTLLWLLFGLFTTNWVYIFGLLIIDLIISKSTTGGRTDSNKNRAIMVIGSFLSLVLLITMLYFKLS